MNINYTEQLINEKGFLNGIYVPWFDKKWFGFDIGKSIYDNYQKCFFDEGYVRSVLTNCKAIGFDMMKIWLNESFEGMLFDESGSVTGVEPTFMKNLKTLFGIADELDLKLGPCINAHQEMYFPENKPLYDKYMRFVYIPEETEKYIENWLTPIIKTASEYSCVSLIDIYAEPEADGGLWRVTRGFSWKSITAFINSTAKAVKRLNPLLATTVSSGSGCYTLKEGFFNGIDVDYYGADIYSDSGNFERSADMLLTKPFMLGEYGVSDYKNATDDSQIATIKGFLSCCEKNRVSAAFYWCYGWKCDYADELHLLNSEGELRKAAAYLHFLQLDRDYRISGKTEADKPVMLALTSPHRLRWFGTRGAKKYLIERSRDKKAFEPIGELISAGEPDGYPDIMRYDDTDGSAAYSYRIISVMSDGSLIASEKSEIICVEAERYA